MNMVIETATYSRSALMECVNLIKTTKWTANTKREHFIKCIEVQRLFDFCLQKTECRLFQIDYSVCKAYIRAINRRAAKRELDAALRGCQRFLCYEINEILTLMGTGEVNEIE